MANGGQVLEECGFKVNAEDVKPLARRVGQTLC